MLKVREFFKKNLLFKSKEKLSIITLLFISLLNIAILITIYIGSDFYKNIISSPSSVFPRLCQNIITAKDIYNTNNYFYQYKNYYDVDKSRNIDSRCNEIIYIKLNALQNDLYLDSLIKTKDIFNHNFKESSLVQDFVMYIENNKKQIIDENENLKRLYKLKLESIYLLFKIPLIIALFYMMRRHLLRRNYVLFITFKSVFYTIFITILISLYGLISNLMPKEFIKNIIKNSYELEVHTLFYYVLMLIILLTFGYIIEKYQARYRNRIKNCKSNNISRVVLHKCENKLK